MLTTLHRWADEGLLRRLDSALAAFMLELDPTAKPALLMSAAILAQMEGRGHTCLPLALLVAQSSELLSWQTIDAEELTTLWATLPPSLPAWLDDLRASSLVRAASELPDRGQPLVLGGTRAAPLLYLRRYWLYERQVAREVAQRTAATQPLDQAKAEQWLTRLFSAAPDKPSQMDWQRQACAVVLKAGLTVITGGPGTGKTYTAARLLALLFAMHEQPERLRVALAAPTGKAAARLRQSIDSSLKELSERLGSTLDLEKFSKRIGAARTLHSLLGARPDTRQFRFNANHLLDVDVLIVDEASMIHLEMMSALLQALPVGAKLILLGDKDQLASVEAGAVLGDLCRNAGQSDNQRTALARQTVMLRHSHRFAGYIGQLALAVNAGNSAQAQRLIHENTQPALEQSVASLLNLAVNGRVGAQACYADYLRLMKLHASTDAASHEAWVKQVLQAFDTFRVLCAVHESDWGTRRLNQTIQQALAEAKLLKPEGEWFAGRPVMVTRNDPELGVFNGDVGVTLFNQPHNALRVYFLDGQNLRSVGVSRLAHVETAFAMTVHKSQGSEFEHTVLVLPPSGSNILTRELVYTGITRARQSFSLIDEHGLLGQAIGRKLERASGLGLQLTEFGSATEK